MKDKLINLDQSLDYLADVFTIELADFEEYISGKTDINIQFGYGNKNIIKLIGEVDKWAISGTQKEARCIISGRDKMKLALETQFQKTYFFNPPFGEKPEGKASTSKYPRIGINTGSGTGGGGVALGIPSGESAEAEEPQTLENKYGENIPYAYGDILASQVAQEACAYCGLELVWDAPDYLIVNAMEDSKGYNAKVSDILRELVSPLNQTEMYKIDIFINNITVFIKKRKYPFKFWDYAYDLSDIRITSR
jgi:hypothetical protein